MQAPQGSEVGARDAGEAEHVSAGSKAKPESSGAPAAEAKEPAAKSGESPPSDESDAKPKSPGAAPPAAAVAEDRTRVDIPFVATVNEAPLACGMRYPEVGSARSSIELSDFRFYVHDVALIDAGGKATPVRLDEGAQFQLRYTKADGSEGGLALLDFATLDSELCAQRGTASTNAVLSGHAPEGKYERLAFTLGVPPELNHVNGADSPAPLSSYGMQWTWASGYRYMKLEVSATTGDKKKDVFYFHPGAAGCSSDSGRISGKYQCENPLLSRIELPFEPGRQAVQADLGRLFATSDLSSGKGCMGTSNLSDPELDGPDAQPRTGCAEIWSTLGLQLGKAVASAPERLGTCAGSTKPSCKSDADCSDGARCAGYQPALKSELARSAKQTTFSTIAYDKQTQGEGARPKVDTLKDDALFGWPHPDYARDGELDVAALSIRNGKDSHEPSDERYGSNCASCHQEHGPGKGRYAISGTIYGKDERVFSEGGVVQIGTGVGNRFGPTVHPIADKIRDFKSLFEAPIDAYGQFYATADQAEQLDYAKQGYFARIVGHKGSCKSPTGQLVKGADGAAVSCGSDADCAALRYTQLGQCKTSGGEAIMANGKPMSCTDAGDCGQQGASCAGASADQVPVCDKLLNAMPLDTVGSCNFCHGSGFRIHSEPTL